MSTFMDVKSSNYFLLTYLLVAIFYTRLSLHLSSCNVYLDRGDAPVLAFLRLISCKFLMRHVATLNRRCLQCRVITMCPSRRRAPRLVTVLDIEWPGLVCSRRMHGRSRAPSLASSSIADAALRFPRRRIMRPVSFIQPSIDDSFYQ